MRHATKQAVQATQDTLLRTAVTSILEETRTSANNVKINLPYNIFTMLGAISEDKVYYRVDLDGNFLTGYEDLNVLTTPQNQENPYFNSSTYRGVQLRQATATQVFLINGNEKKVRVTVAQTQLFQKTILREISRNATIIGVSFLGFALFVALFTTNSFLRPINFLADVVKRRGPHDLRSVKHPTPLELIPLVSSLNIFISRLRVTLRQTETFIAEAAHHIRTPLSLVKSETQLALRKSTDTNNREHLHNIIESVDKSIRSAGQLLDHALVLYRSEQANDEKVDLETVIGHVVSGIRPAAELKDIIINIKIESSTPLLILADRILLEVALRNLIDNAIKYSSAEQQVRVELTKLGSLGIIKVIDSGRGIQGIKMAGFHKRFKRGSNVDDIVGSGLGLAIITEICSAFDGKLELKNNKGGGACAILYFPVY